MNNIYEYPFEVSGISSVYKSEVKLDLNKYPDYIIIAECIVKEFVKFPFKGKLTVYDIDGSQHYFLITSEFRHWVVAEKL